MRQSNAAPDADDDDGPWGPILDILTNDDDDGALTQHALPMM